MLHILADVYMMLHGVAYATVTLSWNSETKEYHIGVSGRWPEDWEMPKDDIFESMQGAWVGFSAKVYMFLKKGMVVQYDWR